MQGESNQEVLQEYQEHTVEDDFKFIRFCTHLNVEPDMVRIRHEFYPIVEFSLGEYVCHIDFKHQEQLYVNHFQANRFLDPKEINKIIEIVVQKSTKSRLKHVLQN